MNLHTKLFGRAYYYETEAPKKKKIDWNYYYKALLTCLNCGTENKVYIRKGKYAKDVAPIIRCQNCKCTMKDCKCSTCSS